MRIPVLICFFSLLSFFDSALSQAEVGIQVGFVKPQFFYKESKFQQLLYEDDSSYHYATSFADKNGQQASAFVRTRKGHWTFSGMLFYQNRKTTSTENYNYYGTTGSYDPFFTQADTLVDSRTVAATMHGIYAAALPGFEFNIGEGKLYLDAGFYVGLLFRSSTSSSGSNFISNDGTQNTTTWTDRISDNPLKGPDAGLMGGFGFNYPVVSNLSLQAEFRASKGIVDIGYGDFGWYGIGKINSVNMGVNLGVLWRFE